MIRKPQKQIDILQFGDLDPTRDDYASIVVDRIFQAAITAGASDIHITQSKKTVALRYRVHGRLIDVGSVDDGASTSILGRLKALAKLITYRCDVPQEGRLVLREQQIEARVGTLPTLHGERAVVRLAMSTAVDWIPSELGLPDNVLGRLLTTLAKVSGVILITGPAGSGKTTTAYACLRAILDSVESDADREGLELHTGPRGIVTLEDPVEREIAGTAQSQIDPASGYDWSAGLRALLRQDPEVMMVGEIRDPETASVVFQAAMTGQLVISTMHARSAADALRRLLDMGVPVQHLLSGLDLLVCQRLLPWASAGSWFSKLSASSAMVKAERATGPQMQLLAEMLPPIQGDLARAIVRDADSETLQACAVSSGMTTLATLAVAAEKTGRDSY